VDHEGALPAAPGVINGRTDNKKKRTNDPWPLGRVATMIDRVVNLQTLRFENSIFITFLTTIISDKPQLVKISAS
jgi:hypothetical protein